VQVRSFGAVGNGVTDDTAALQAAIASLTPGDVLQIPAGYTFAHSDVLDIATASVRVTGGGTLLATNEARSSVWLDADGVTLDNVTLRMGTTTKRWDAYEQMKLRLTAHAGITVTNVTVDGSAAAGIFVSGASDFTLTDVTVKNTRADAIHMTGGSHDGRVVRPTTQNSGDDGVAIVSYADKPVCHHITVQSPRFYGQTWGRAFSVVGGEDVTFTDVYAERSSSASIYLATEANYDTLATKRVLVDGGTIVSANQDATVGHGAILVYSGKPGMTDSDITVRNLTIRDTRATAPRQVGVVTSNGGSVARVTFANMTLVAGPQNVFGGTAPDSAVNRTAWTWNGKAVADAIGWS
jgi:polygalacturonase